ncbi:hypothetical protein [Brevibacillus panacihumi]|uniref:hypothetical protein n=1 Tax=Brevibacillus panacihumi TaxID=497735 RepID=UPI003D2579DD
MSIAAVAGRIRFPVFAPFFVRKDVLTVRSATLGGESQKQPTLRSSAGLRFFFPPIVAPLGGTTQWAVTGNLILPRS